MTTILPHVSKSGIRVRRTAENLNEYHFFAVMLDQNGNEIIGSGIALNREDLEVLQNTIHDLLEEEF